eukprot:CAMPEP_0116087392 /NCGR_PEP_ID=MMETSP0327-20121206/5339_1 /TAXON_ID=44447 /ORGANISM="Pseudo-nitzschia delicatissima, Strain B596" /LENGTH=254 /DNA_ID=CAMNT_0003578457 /DNA_START=152 /DNA_END=916 /DNA_ORIENTATION=-
MPAASATGHVRVKVPGAAARNTDIGELAGPHPGRSNDAQLGHAVIGIGPSISSMDTPLDIVFKHVHQLVQFWNGQLGVRESCLQLGRDLSQPPGHACHIDNPRICSLAQHWQHLFGKVDQSVIVGSKGFGSLPLKGCRVGSLVGKARIVHQNVDASIEFPIDAPTKFRLALRVANFQLYGMNPNIIRALIDFVLNILHRRRPSINIAASQNDVTEKSRETQLKGHKVADSFVCARHHGNAIGKHVRSTCTISIA